MLNFPDAPTVGQQFTSSGVVWQWDGTKWLPASTSGSGFLPLSGGTMTGPLGLAADPASALQAATKEYVDAGDALALAGGYGGFVNKLRNPGMDVWQRGSPITVSAGANSYTADGWLVAPTGASPSISVYQTKLTGAYSGSSLVMGSATGLTSTILQHRIESWIAAALAGRQCTFQIRIWNNTPNPVTPTLATYMMNSRDVISAITADLATVNLQTIAPGATAVVAYTFPVGAGASLGYVLNLGFGAALNAASVSCVVTDADFRATPGVATGLNANPPPPELRPISTETVFCQRYYAVGPSINLAGYIGAASGLYVQWSAPVVMRATPTMSAGWPAGVNVSGGTIAALSDRRTISGQLTGSTTGPYSATWGINWLSAEL